MTFLALIAIIFFGFAVYNLTCAFVDIPTKKTSQKLCFRCSPARRPSLLNSIRLRYNAAILLYWSRHTPLVTVPLCRCLRQA